MHTLPHGISRQHHERTSTGSPARSFGMGSRPCFNGGSSESRGRGQYDGPSADRVVSSANQAGLRLIVRVEYTPSWARWDHNTAGPPDRYEDYGNFLNALANRYKKGSPYGHIDAIEVWNEPNLAYEWGNNPPIPRSTARLLFDREQRREDGGPEHIVVLGRPLPDRHQQRRRDAGRSLPAEDVRGRRQRLLRRSGPTPPATRPRPR